MDDGSPYMVMELQEGRSLADVFDEMQLPIAALVGIARQLLAGLAAAHAAGVVHRDIKPDNVMIVRDVKGDVVVKLVDFGISMTVRTDVDGGTTDEDLIIGSPDYMAPEQFRGADIDVRTDLYAVGVLLYEGITRRLPFTGESMADLLISVFQDKVELPSALRADCPPELERVVLAAMSRDPALRPQSAEQMSRALDQLAGPRQEAGINLDVLEEQSRDKRATGAHRRRTADLRTLQDLGAQVQRRSRAWRAQRIALFAAGGMAVLVLIAVLSHSRSTPPAAAGSTPRPAIAHAPSTPPEPTPAQVPAAGTDAPPAPSPAAIEPSIPDAKPAANPPVQARERTARTTSSRGARRAAASTLAKPASPAAPAAPAAPAKPSSADATATTALFREAAIAFVHGDSARSRDLYSQVLARDPARADAYRGLGLACARLGRRAEAARAFERYLQMRPDAADAARIRAELAKLR
jgi:serine/threonine-protein kinase